MNKEKKRREEREFNFAINFHISILKKSPTFSQKCGKKKDKKERKKQNKKIERMELVGVVRESKDKEKE